MNNKNNMHYIMDNWRKILAESNYQKQEQLLNEGVTDFVFKKIQELVNKIVKGLQETSNFKQQLEVLSGLQGVSQILSPALKASQEISSIQVSLGTPQANQNAEQVRENLIKEFKNIEKYIKQVNKTKNYSLKNKFIIENKKEIEEGVLGTVTAFAGNPYYILLAAVPFCIILFGKLIKFIGLKEAGNKVIMLGEKIEIAERTIVEMVTLPATYQLVANLLKGLKTKSKMSQALIPDTVQPYWENEKVQDLTLEEWMGQKMNEGLGDVIGGVGKAIKNTFSKQNFNTQNISNRYNKGVHDAEHHLNGHDKEQIDSNLFKTLLNNPDPNTKKELLKDIKTFLYRIEKEGAINPTDADAIMNVYNHIKDFAKRGQRVGMSKLQYAEKFEEDVSKNIHYIRLKTQSPNSNQNKIRENSIQILRNGISHIVALIGVIAVGIHSGGHIIHTIKSLISSIQSSGHVVQTIAAHGEQIKDAVEHTANAAHNTGVAEIFANIIHAGEGANDTARLTTTAIRAGAAAKG